METKRRFCLNIGNNLHSNSTCITITFQRDQQSVCLIISHIQVQAFLFEAVVGSLGADCWPLPEETTLERVHSSSAGLGKRWDWFSALRVPCSCPAVLDSVPFPAVCVPRSQSTSPGKQTSVHRNTGWGEGGTRVAKSRQWGKSNTQEAKHHFQKPVGDTSQQRAGSYGVGVCSGLCPAHIILHRASERGPGSFLIRMLLH